MARMMMLMLMMLMLMMLMILMIGVTVLKRQWAITVTIDEEI